MLVLLVALSAVWGRLVGVPSSVKAVLVQEFALRGLHIDMGKVPIDP